MDDMDSICHTHAHTHARGWVPRESMEVKMVVGHKEWLEASLGPRDSPQTQGSHLAIVRVHVIRQSPVLWGHVLNT